MSVTVEMQFEVQTLIQLKRLAQTQGSSIQKLANEAVRVYVQDRLPTERGQKLEQEVVAYSAMHSELLEKYPGSYVAVHKGEAIDSDSDRLSLYLRVRYDFPQEEILIRQVRPEVERTLIVRSPRIERE